MAAPIHAVEASGVARFMREALWAYPITEAVHIVGLALLFGSIVIIDLRLLGAGRKIPAAALVSYAVPWSLAGFVLAAASVITNYGAGMTGSELSHHETKDMAPVGGARLAAILAEMIAAGETADE